MTGDFSVSVVIPTYNSATYLPDAIASVRAQNWPELEIVVVDDGSTDGTAEVLEALAASDMRCIRQANAGPAAARNTAIAASRGRWIAFLDADDRWLPDKLALQFAEIRRRPDVDFCYTDERLQPAGRKACSRTCRTSQGPLFLELLSGNRFGTPTVVVRRDCFRTVGPFDTALRTGEDWDMWLRLSACFRDAYVPRPLALVRKRSGAGQIDLQMLESCTLRVLSRLFASSQISQRYPQLATQRGRVYAWHCTVLAKSYLRRYRVAGFCRLALRALRSHPVGLHHLSRRHAVAPLLNVFSGEARAV